MFQKLFKKVREIYIKDVVMVFDTVTFHNNPEDNFNELVITEYSCFDQVRSFLMLSTIKSLWSYTKSYIKKIWSKNGNYLRKCNRKEFLFLILCNKIFLIH